MLGPAGRGVRRPPHGGQLTFEEYVGHDATGLAGLIRSGEVSATELLECALARLHEVNPTLNAVVRLLESEARAAAARPPEGAFAGVPFLVKDLMSHMEGHPTSAGSRLLRHLPMGHDTELVRRVRATGMSILGKTNTPEWGLVPYTEPEVWGPTRNPWDLERTPGGSSGGSGAAVAAGVVPMAGGGDGGGSIRIPASCCGLFGLKPTRGRVPTGPDLGEVWRGAVVEHVLTRSVRDSARMLDATHGPEPGSPYEIAPPERPFIEEVGADPGRLRIAWTTEPSLGASVHPDCVSAVEDAVGLLGDLGHELVEADLPVDREMFSRAFLIMVVAELAADMTDAAVALGRKPRRGDLEPATWAAGMLAGAFSAREYAGALRTLGRAARRLGRFCEPYDLVLTPTLASPPPPVGELAPTPKEEMQLRLFGALGSGRLLRAVGLLDEMASTAFEFIPWTPVFNVTGQPAMSVPLWWNASGLPVGVHLVGGFGDEATLYRLAGQLEQARPWFDRLPRWEGSNQADQLNERPTAPD